MTTENETMNLYKDLVKNYTPLFVSTIYRKVYFFFIKMFSISLPVYSYKGIMCDGGSYVHFTYIGRNLKTIDYWLNHLFDSYESIQVKNRKISKRNIENFLSASSIPSDIAIIEMDDIRTVHYVKDLDGFVMPKWLKMNFQIDESILTRKKNKDCYRLIKKHSIESEKSTSLEDFKLFYYKMFKPYVYMRHKNSAVIEDYKKMLCDFKKKKSVIYFATINGEKKAGMLMQYIDDIPYLYGLGVLDASEEYMKMGVVGALYYYFLKECIDNNIKRANVGGTSSLLSDGLTRFKLTVGAKASDMTHQDSPRLKFMILNNTNEINNFLKHNPLIYIENNELYTALFVDQNKELTEKQLQINSFAYDNGTKETRVFNL